MITLSAKSSIEVGVQSKAKGKITNGSFRDGKRGCGETEWVLGIVAELRILCFLKNGASVLYLKANFLVFLKMRTSYQRLFTIKNGKKTVGMKAPLCETF